MMRDMHQGEPGAGDEGLDHTHSWGRTYWGGAMFCLVADVAIREKTHNRKGLRDALRAIVEHGGTIDQNWDLPKALAIGDAATGNPCADGAVCQMEGCAGHSGSAGAVGRTRRPAGWGSDVVRAECAHGPYSRSNRGRKVALRVGSRVSRSSRVRESGAPRFWFTRARRSRRAPSSRSRSGRPRGPRGRAGPSGRCRRGHRSPGSGASARRAPCRRP